MIKFLSDYIVTEQELTKVSQDIHDKVDTCLAGEDRLHNFLQLYEIASTIIKSLESVDKSGFLTQIKKDLENIHANLDKELSKKASEYKKQLDEIEQIANTAESELQKRGACIDSVLEGMQKISDFKTQTDEVRQKMSEIESSIKTLVELRQSAPFEEMCKLAANEH